MTTEEKKDKILNLCIKSLKKHGLIDDNRYKDRLKKEVYDLDGLAEWDYVYELLEKNQKFAKNENNLLVMWLLGIVNDFDIENEGKFIIGDYPDIDCDYMDVVRDYLKHEWASKEFGAENVCGISNYSTFGIKGSLIDMARVYGKDRNEIINLTTKLGLKDDDGHALTWDKAMEIYPDLKAYCDRNPEVAIAAKKLIGRNRGKGVHAGGLIISSKPIDELVPLVTNKGSAGVSAFTEGLHRQDLGPLGLIKFDLLSITNLMQIALAVKMIKERHNLESFCALEGQDDWSDTSYLEDKKALKLANDGKLKGIFQFDSLGIRELAKLGGVDKFDDLVAYASLFRPGPISCSMHTSYCNRKQGRESYETHDLLKPILDSTYGVLCFQEQIMRIFNVAGGFPLTECYKIVKAISKKKGDVFKKARDGFISNCQLRLGYTEEKSIEFFDQLAGFSEYAFNRSHSVSYSYISSRLLYLKAHYPLEFYTAILQCEKKGETNKGDETTNKTMEYKLDAEKMGIKLHKIDLNKSKDNWSIIDGEIYMGFGNIKGIGPDVAQRIVKNQPYYSFEDFLKRFGTDAKVIKPLIALRSFKEADPIVLYEFYENYKKDIKKREERTKRNLTSREKIVIQISEWAEKNKLLETTVESKKTEWINYFLSNCTQVTTAIELQDVVFKESEVLDIIEDMFVDWAEGIKLIKKYRKNVDSIKKKEEEEAPVITMEVFEGPTGEETDEKMMEILSGDIQVAESVYLGFEWNPLLAESSDYQGYVFNRFDEDEDLISGVVEVHVIDKPKKNVWKSGKGYSYSVNVKDGHGRIERITFWKEDYENWFDEELNFWESNSRKGNLLRMRVKRPEPGRQGFTFESPSKQDRHRKIPKEKRLDARMVVMARPELKEIVLKPKQEILDDMKDFKL